MSGSVAATGSPFCPRVRRVPVHKGYHIVFPLFIGYYVRVDYCLVDLLFLSLCTGTPGQNPMSVVTLRANFANKYV